MLTILLSIDCSKMAQIRINTRTHTKEKPYLINSYFLSKLVRQKKAIGWAKYVYVCVWDMCWRNFCNFSLVTKNVKSRSKIALFSNERHFGIWFPKREQLRISEVNDLNYTKKDPILHETTTFSLKQGETWTSHGPIPPPLKIIRCKNTTFLQTWLKKKKKKKKRNQNKTKQSKNKTKIKK